MQLRLTEEQTLIESSVLSLLAGEYDFQRRQRSLQAPDACNPELWSRFASLGWLALSLPERVGGLACGALATGLLMQAFGRHLVVEPYHACVLLATRLLAELGTATQCDRWLPALTGGRMRAALAHEELANPSPWSARLTTAVRRNGQWELRGRKHLVVGAPGAALLLVSASVGAATGGTPGQRVFLVAPDAPGVLLRPALLSDGAHAADLELQSVRIGDNAILGEDVDVAQGLSTLYAQGVVASCWEASGAMRAVHEQTVAYTQRRIQFAQPLSKFQVVAHRLAEMAVQCAEAQAACELAALRIERGEPDTPALASMAKSKVGRAARFVAQQAVQLHGAMGVSEELPVASYFRKLTAFAQQAGATAWHSHHYGTAMLACDAWRASRSLPDLEHQVHAEAPEVRS